MDYKRGGTMIKCKNDYLYYLETDRLGMHIKRKKPRLLVDEVWKFTRLLRKIEYLTNCKKGIISEIFLQCYRFQLHKLGLKIGFSIPINVFGAGLILFHWGTIVVSANAKVGNNCQLYCCTNIADGVEIGDNVFIAPGVKILNNVKIADGVRIGANSVVTKDILESNITVAGAPAVKVSEKGMKDHQYLRSKTEQNELC